MARRRLILHIGTHKTGTSYLQKLFLVHRDVLASESVALAEPPHPVTGDHHAQVAFLQEIPPNYDRFLASLDTDHETVLVSSEALFHYFMIDMRSDAFPGVVQPLFDVSVVLYLRRQDFLKESVFAEVASTWYQGNIHDENHYFYDFSAIVERVVKLFGAASLRLGIYRDDRPQDLVTDFLCLCGLERLIGRMQAIPRERVSLDRRKLALLAMIPKQDPTFVERVRQAALHCLAPDTCKYILSPTERRSFLEQYIETNRRVAQTFRPDAEAYLTGTDAVPETWSPVAPFTPSEVANLLTIVCGAVPGGRPPQS